MFVQKVQVLCLEVLFSIEAQLTKGLGSVSRGDQYFLHSEDERGLQNFCLEAPFVCWLALFCSTLSDLWMGYMCNIGFIVVLQGFWLFVV